MKRDFGFWMIQVPGWLLLSYLVYAQAITAFGAAFWYGFALADLMIYIPLLALGLIGCWTHKKWGQVTLASALGITVYWPIVYLAAVTSARNAPGWNLTGEAADWVVLSLIAI